MKSSANLPERFPIGTKYVLEGRGALVQRYIELPNGHRIKLKTRIRRIASPSFARVSGDGDAGWGNEPHAADAVFVRGVETHHAIATSDYE